MLSLPQVDFEDSTDAAGLNDDQLALPIGACVRPCGVWRVCAWVLVLTLEPIAHSVSAALCRFVQAR